MLAFFASLILHELGHALVARRNGLGVVGIDLWAFGGITRTSGPVERPGVEFRVAAAGPLVTLGVIIVCIAAGALLTTAGTSSRWPSATAACTPHRRWCG